MKQDEISLEQIRAFVEGSGEIQFRAAHQSEMYGWVEETLRAQGYKLLARGGKGLVKRYIAKMSGLSRAQVTRLIAGTASRGR